MLLLYIGRYLHVILETNGFSLNGSSIIKIVWTNLFFARFRQIASVVFDECGFSNKQPPRYLQNQTKKEENKSAKVSKSRYLVVNSKM